MIEPGRAIAARAGMTLCRVIAVKRQPGGRTFVAVDGGSGDIPRTGSPGAKYTVALANRHRPTATAPVTVVGRRGTGDEIARGVELPADIRPEICWRWPAPAPISTQRNQAAAWWVARR